MKGKEGTLPVSSQLRDHGQTLAGYMAPAGHSGDLVPHLWSKKENLYECPVVSATENNVTITVSFVTNEENREMPSSFHVVHVLLLQKQQISDHMESPHLHRDVGTTCQKLEILTVFQEGELYSKSSATFQCFLLWFGKYRILHKHCNSDS